MRTKSETRRNAILKAAAEIFTATGFERTSMEDIRLHVGYSKATLYSYFTSKEELFLEVLLEATEAEFQATHAALDPALEDIEKALTSFGVRLLTLLYVSPVKAVRQLVISEAGRSELGRKCYEVGPRRSQAALSEFLGMAMVKRQLRQADPHIAALHLLGLLEAEWIYQFIFHTMHTPSEKEIATTAGRSISVFMAAYGPLPRAGNSPGR